MVRSKYLGQVYDNNWKVISVELAGRYGKRLKAKGNSYRFILARETSDGKFEKYLSISHPTMVKIGRHEWTVEYVEALKRRHADDNEYRNVPTYKFK